MLSRYVPRVLTDLGADSRPHPVHCRSNRCWSVFSARCNVYISRLSYDVNVCLSVHLSVTEVHWRIIANLSFKFRSQFTHIAVAVHAGAREGIIAGTSGGIILRYASHC